MLKWSMSRRWCREIEIGSDDSKTSALKISKETDCSQRETWDGKFFLLFFKKEMLNDQIRMYEGAESKTQVTGWPSKDKVGSCPLLEDQGYAMIWKLMVIAEYTCWWVMGEYLSDGFFCLEQERSMLKAEMRVWRGKQETWNNFMEQSENKLAGLCWELKWNE